MGDSPNTDLSHHLPLQLLKSETIPPSPNRSESGSATAGAAVDWLPEFAGYSWVAYGASSLLVISHFPSPLSPQQSRIGPIFRQVFDLHSPSSADVAAVSWSMAAPSSGDLAAAADNRIFVFQYDSNLGSFCWSQNALLLQSAKVEAIAWTGSGDGIISGGMEVVLWKRNIKSWEIAWKSRMEVSHALVSTTWSLEGPSAASAYPSKHPAEGPSLATCKSSYCVSVFQNDRKSGYVTTELRHPQPVLAMQWRPSGGSSLNRDALYTPKNVLLTSCLDGAVRLWTEFDGSKTRKSSKDIHDPSATRRPFCVVAVIEINQSLDGILGTNIFLNWALEVDGVACMGDSGNHLLSSKRLQDDHVGRCEWLIGLGPGRTLTFWAVHCLDDIATMRSPRITLWKRLEIEGPALRNFCGNGHPRFTEGSHFKKFAMWRNHMFGPPNICSLVQLFPCNSLGLSVLYDQSFLNVEDEKSSQNCETDSNLSCQSDGILDTLGHTGKILQVAVHPSNSKVQLAVSLDSNGLLLFWSICSSPSSISGLPVLNPSWQVVGEFPLQGTISRDMRLYWAPSLLDEDRILLVGHAPGIDCFIIKTCESDEEKILFHKLCTVPFISHDHIGVPDEIISVPLRSTCKATFKCNHFLLLAVWMKNCQVALWTVTLRCYELSGNCCECNFNTISNECSTCVYKADFAGKTYHVVVDSLSSYLPLSDEITSIAMVFPSIVMPSLQQNLDLVNASFSNNFPYHMATGHSDGRSRLWRISLSNLPVACTPFELVGMFSSLQGPISAIAVADCGQKIATICQSGRTNGATTLCIWEPLHLAGAGTVVLEDKICLDGDVVALRWFLVENLLFLGVCFQKELHIYSHRLCCQQTSLNLGKPSESSIWGCTAIVRTSHIIYDFLLGPRETIIIIHEKYFSLFSQWSFHMGNKHLIDGHLNPDSALTFRKEIDKDSPRLLTRDIHSFGELLFERSSHDSSLISPLIKGHNVKPSFLPANVAERNHNLQNKICFIKMTEVAEKLCGPLPFYHPEALLMNIYSGNWKRAYVAVCHLAECLALNPKQKPSTAKSSSIRQIKLSNYFEGRLSNVEGSQGFQLSKDLNTINWSAHSETGLMQVADNSVHNDINSLFTTPATTSESCESREMLEKLQVLESLTDSQKMKMFAVVDLLREISNSQTASAYESLDKSGRRFWCSIRLQQLEFRRRYSKMALMPELVVDSGVIAWAFHSDCQMNLLNTVVATEPTWEEMRKMGVGFWFTSLTDMRTKMEKLARCQYLKSKDPKACALLYIALNRLQVLAGLFKISKNEKDKPLVAFLTRNFQEEKHKAAALKNAYVLMGRHQLELAIAFFLLGGDISSAVTVCAKTLGDDQLALVICRLVEGQGGPAERHLISRILLPAAIEKGDYWLASILEWMLGNYLRSFLIILGLQGDSQVSELEESFQGAVFLDPNIGQYCQMLAAKHSLRNAVGEQNSAIMGRWATAVTASALNKCGLPLEALEWLSSSASVLGDTDKAIDSGSSEILPRVLRPSSADSSRWLSNEVACHLEYQVKLDLAVQYIMKVMREHPCWMDTSLLLTQTEACSQEHEMSQYGALLKNFEEKLDSSLAYLEQKFYLTGDLLLNKIFVSLGDDRLCLIGYHLSNTFASPVFGHALDHIGSSSQLLKQLTSVADYLSYSVPRFVTASSIASSRTTASSECDVSVSKPYCCFQFLEWYLRGILFSICHLRAALVVLHNSSYKELIAQCAIVYELCNYCIYFASAMLQHNIKALAVMLQPVLVSCTDINYGEVDLVSLRAILIHVVEALGPKSSSANTCRNLLVAQGSHHENGWDKTCMLPEDEKWRILGTCLWQYLSKFIKHQLNQLLDKLNSISIVDTSALASSVSPTLDYTGSLKHVRQVTMILIEAISNSFTHISSHSARQLSDYFWQKAEDGTSVPTLMGPEEFTRSNSNGLHEHLQKTFGSSEVLNGETSCSVLLEKIFGDAKTVSEMLVQLPIKFSEKIQSKPIRGWKHLNMGVLGQHEKLESYKQEGIFDGNPREETGSPSAGSEPNINLTDSAKRGAAVMKKVVPFCNPRETYRRNGELLEALCINPIEHHQAALASNRKGISFFNWGDELPSGDSSDYIWSKAEWPQNGWAGAESTPIPTCVSPGIGLGSDKGLHLGLGGATVGVGTQARAGKDLTGGGAFGIPGYAGVGATGMGWGIQEDFDNFIDPPATLDNINARTLASHPSRPLFLVGSSNTHIYLWEFGEEKAAATYGVLPAANVPPPYALASISALQFDRCGHRFSNSASDGTVCTWQLEVGGRSNVRPTESSLCFNGHASDICYVATSGSIIAAAGYSSNGVNVVIWDTLAPPTSSRASVMCHEGGACSIAVFDNDKGTSSVSPLIVTGGKGGDVGLHDFRYIATGKTKRNRQSNSVERITDVGALDVRSELSSSAGDQNRHGMLWYIPKAHSGSVTKIATIPNTSLFLTGSKDGDVKLWDASRARLVFHWPKLHERHTFLQRSSQGFGGVTRVGVTDIQVLSDGFLTCGGDGLVKLVQLT